MSSEPKLPQGFSLSYHPQKDPEGNPAITAKILYSGQPVGSIVAMFQRGLGKFRVVDSDLSPQFRGKGVAQAAYRQLHLHLKSKTGVGLASDKVRSNDANNLWNALKRKGLARGPVSIGDQGGMVYVMERSISNIEENMSRGAWDMLAESFLAVERGPEGPWQILEAGLFGKKAAAAALAGALACSGPGCAGGEVDPTIGKPTVNVEVPTVFVDPGDHGGHDHEHDEDFDCDLLPDEGPCSLACDPDAFADEVGVPGACISFRCPLDNGEVMTYHICSPYPEGEDPNAPPETNTSVKNVFKRMD